MEERIQLTPLLSDRPINLQYQPRIKVAIIGLYRSGSSALASVLEGLGVWMGAPYYESYFESATLASALRRWWSEPELVEQASAEVRERGLLEWLQQQCAPGREVVGAKHPLLSLSASDVVRAWGSDTKFIWAHRGLEESIASLKAKGWMKQPELIQTYLWHQTSEFCSRHPHLAVPYRELTKDPVGTVRQIVEYLKLEATEDEIRGAASLIKPARSSSTEPKRFTELEAPKQEQPSDADSGETKIETGLAVVTLWRGEWNNAQAALLHWMQEEQFPPGTKFVWVMPKASAAEKILEAAWDSFETRDLDYQCEFIVSPVISVRTNVQKHMLVASLYNEALKNVYREWVIFIEDDVIPDKDGLKALLESIQSQPPHVAVVAACYRRRLNLDELCAVDARWSYLPWPVPGNESLQEVLWTGGGFASYRGQALRGAGKLFASVQQGRMTGGWDVNLCRVLRGQGYKIVVNMAIHAEHRFDEDVNKKKSAPRRLDPAAEGNPLRNYFEQNKGRLIDKWIHYFEIYHRHFARFIAKKPTILEIGISHGGSLEMWKNYFGPGTRVIGVDQNPLCGMFLADDVEIYIGDQSDLEFLQKLAHETGPFDIVIDDGGHQMQQQIRTLEALLPAVNDKGVFLVEDLHTSYWPQYGGGLQRPGSFIEYSKRLIDELNGWHLRDEGRGVTDFTKSIDSMTFYDSVLVLEKRCRPRPVSRKTGHRAF